MPAILFDLVILALLAFFAWRGAARGLILSLCSLAAVFVAFFGAQFISDQFCKPVAGILQPIITQTLEKVEPPSISLEGADQAGYTMDELLASVRDADLFSGFSAFMEEGAAGSAIQQDSHRTPLDALASYLATGIARALLFALAYLAVVLGWFLASHALDLAFHLPILSQVNLAGGLIVGLVKGALLIVVMVWLGQLAGWVPARPDTPVLSLFTVEKLGHLLQDLPL